MYNNKKDLMFINILFGHFIGEYLLQGRWVTKNKFVIYTISVSLFTLPIVSFNWILFIYLTYILVYDMSLVDKWLQFKNGHSLVNYSDGTPRITPPIYFCKESQRVNCYNLNSAFIAIEYTIARNTIQLLLLWLGMIWLT